MAFRSVILLLAFVASAVFIALNWAGVMTPVPVNLVYTQTEAPLGLILVLVLGGLWVIGLLWAIIQNASALFAIRRAYREAQASRKLAESAEVSRLDKAHKAMHEEVVKLEGGIAKAVDAIAAEHAGQVASLVKEVEGLRTTIDSVNRKFEAICVKAGITLPAPEPEKKHLFGFLGRKEQAPVDVTPVNDGAGGQAAKEARPEVSKNLFS